MQKEYQELALSGEELSLEEAQRVSLKRTPFTMVREQSSGYLKGVHDILESAEKEREKRITNYQQDLSYLNKIETELQRIWLCLKASSPKSFLILNRLYVKKEKWDNVVYEMNISKTTLSRLREKGLEEVKVLYESELSNREINTTVRKKGVFLDSQFHLNDF